MCGIGSLGRSREVDRRTISIALISDPDLPAEIAEDLSAPFATVGGALGSGLESNAAVRAAAYRYQPEQSDD